MRTCWCLGLAAVLGCSGEVRSMSSTASPASASTSAERSVALVASGDPGCDGEAVGVVDAPFVYGDEARSRQALKAEAAKRGADAVVDVKHVTNEGEEHLLGTAVRCRALREARPFDVLGQIDVPELEGGPEAAFAALRARAYEMNADLVVDVRLASDAEDHAHVTGTAIKYR
jgi:uncharacterized protein YbjQ (UPF0145 family)